MAPFERSPTAALIRFVALGTSVGLLAAPTPAEASCAGAGRTVDSHHLAAARAATLCLVNVERRRRGLGPLAPSTKLRRAAEVLSRDMVIRGVFAHRSLAVRVGREGYLRGFSAWRIGENLAWGEGPESTPRAVLGAWMRSRKHRADVLSRAYTHLGVGIVIGTPAGTPGATYTADFGRRRR